MSADHRIDFILCTNDPIYLAECEKYIGRLVIPDDTEISVIPITGAASMCAGYNQGMRQSDARIRIYLHQDVMILNRYFLVNILTLFAAHPEAGMIGMAGSERLSDIGVMWRGPHNEVGALYKPTDEESVHDRVTADWPVALAECIDGFLIAAREDIPWREDLFDGWDFYDASQSMEYRRQGFQILIPEQTTPWCLHDDGKILSLCRYDHYREIFLREYGSEIDRFATIPKESINDRKKPQYRQTDDEYVAMLKKLGRDAADLQTETARILSVADTVLRAGDIDAFSTMTEEFSSDAGRNALVHSTELLRIKQMIEAVRTERQAGIRTFIDGVGSAEGFRAKYLRCTFALREIELGASEEERKKALRYLREIALSAFSAAAIIYNVISLLGHREKILMILAEDALEQGEIVRAWQFLSAVQQPSEEVSELRKELGEHIYGSAQDE